MKANGDGTKTVSCADGTSVTVADGANGANGTNGTNGSNGTSCAVTNNGNGTRTITCGDGSTLTVFDAVIDYSAMTATEKAEAAMSAVATSVTIPADGRPEVKLKVSDRRGYAVKGLTGLKEGSTTALALSWRVSLLKLASGVNGSANDTWVSYMAANDHSSANTETGAKANVTDNGDGTYTYKFTKVVNAGANAAGTTYEADKAHRFVLLLSDSNKGFAPVNLVKDFIPSTAVDVTGQNEKVDPAACVECHTTFRLDPKGAGRLGKPAFHGGARFDIRTCVACHNDQQRFDGKGATLAEPTVGTDGKWTDELHVLNGEAFINLPVFIHKIHMGEKLTMKGGPYWKVTPYETTYPQDVRNCTKCHRTAKLADNWKNKPSRRACGACHDGTSFLEAIPNGRTEHGQPPLGGPQANDAECTKSCHTPDMTVAHHLPVADKANTGFYIAASETVPAGALKITYDVKSVSAYWDSEAEKWRPQIVFRFLKQDPNALPKAEPTPVEFKTFVDATSTPEMMDNFTGSPSVYFAYAVTQDGNEAPTDFNVSTSGYIKSIWNGTASSTGSLSAPDSSGYYTLKLTQAIPANATMLTGGIGYSYNRSKTPPLTQTNVEAYKVADDGTGGLVVPAPNIAVAASGCAPGTAGGPPAGFCTARKKTVDTGSCNSCHGTLGVNPTFHGGQRNDGPTCSFCHTPNRTSTGWSSDAKYFVHAIHAAGMRENNFTWDATVTGTGSSAVVTGGFWLATYPGVLNKCETCHVKGMYDFSSIDPAKVLYTTVGAGKYESTATSTAANASPIEKFSPWVSVDKGDDYGSGFSTSATGCFTDAPCAAAPTTLVISPITTVCSSCHDSPAAIDHMKGEGGSFYEARSTALTKPERCLMCHGPGTIAAIAQVHATKP